MATTQAEKIYPKAAYTELKLDKIDWDYALRLTKELDDQKWLYSKQAKRDIGTPQTIANTLLVACGIKQTVDLKAEPDWGRSQMMARFKDFSDGLVQNNPDGTYEQVVELLSLAYLLGDRLNDSPYVQPEECSRLEGELQRHWAQKHGINDWQSVGVTPAIVADYCRDNGLVDHISLLDRHMAAAAMSKAEKAYFQTPGR